MRLVTRPLSTTTSSSTQFPPALRTSVLIAGQEVNVRPRTTSASISSHGAVTNGSNRLSRLRKGFNEFYCRRCRTQRIRILKAAWQNQGIEILRLGLIQGKVNSKRISLLTMNSRLDFSAFQRDDAWCRDPRLLMLPEDPPILLVQIHPWPGSRLFFQKS